MKRLTHKQADVLRYIARYQNAHGRAPTVREICREFGFRSTNGCRCHLAALESHGCLTRTTYHPRSITLTPAAIAFVARTALTPQAAA